ncbi:MAG TPA: MotA/TolQ/ExbB proton channel family protein, partial [Gemmataceae bacterium]|nr:MotA/TolQ/ExbB proton channel family protein [Gemmataceae bacterium]
MSRAENTGRPPRSSSTLAAFAIGIPLSIGVLAAVQVTDTELKRYLHHPVEIVEVVLFCCALGGLAAKLLGNAAQRAACRREMLPPWDGKPVPASEAPRLRAELENNAGRLRNTLLARRIDAVLDFVAKRGNVSGVDDQLRALADNDNLVLDNSYSLIRFITWAIPILGFLGTVLGITTAIGNVTNEIAEGSISSVTGGLSLAFDTTAVGLALTIATMFLSFLTERSEQTVLEFVDHYADVQLAHRFEQAGTEQGEFVAALRQNTQILLETTEQLVQQQANVWAGALASADKRWADAGKRQQELLTVALEQALEKTLTAHQTRLVALEQHVEKQGSALLGQLTAVAGAIRDMGREHQQ